MTSIRDEYQEHGVEDYYRDQGASYRNPHEAGVQAAIRAAVARWGPDLGYVLDLACGSGEATLVLREVGVAQIDGIDPYTYAAYEERTGQPAERFTFADVEAGALTGRHYTLIVCSYAMHLVEPSRLPVVAYQLARIGEGLLIVTPHKHPPIRAAWGWSPQGECLRARVRARYYRSTLRPAT